MGGQIVYNLIKMNFSRQKYLPMFATVCFIYDDK